MKAVHELRTREQLVTSYPLFKDVFVIALFTLFGDLIQSQNTREKENTCFLKL